MHVQSRVEYGMTATADPASSTVLPTEIWVLVAAGDGFPAFVVVTRSEEMDLYRHISWTSQQSSVGSRDHDVLNALPCRPATGHLSWTSQQISVGSRDHDVLEKGMCDHSK